MTWRYQKVGRHIHISVYLDGRLYIGKLVVTKSEFAKLQTDMADKVKFINEDQQY